MEYKYVIQRRFQTELAKKVGGAMKKIFDNPSLASLHVNETITEISTPKPLTKGDINRICTHLLKQARLEGDKETMAFECVPYNESITAKAEGEK